ncbi:helix-turn-helix domain-containing protein [uncultured Caulobacter sp.]|uniref:winged helix-turn-helix transcriptional regulator n=1 Tax=uncultured Caulobacter sp. TaxID=158749 RepID=UPI00260FD301|nr:helix-turn-helix domain-containing protein [uncultured Caulobacter sp.]
MSKSERAPTQCPIGRTLERVGDCWTFLILRDASQGLTRFDQFEKSLGVAPNILTKRLAALVDSGLMEKRLYQRRPPRHDYVLTDLGRDFGGVLTAMLAFGNRHFAPEGAAGQLVDRETGRVAEPIVVDRVSGKPITPELFAYATGPGAGPEMLARVAFMAERRAKP